MSTIPSPALFDTAIDGPILETTALEGDVAEVLERIVAARRELEQFEAERERMAHALVTTIPAGCAEARRRLDAAQAELEAYVKARVEGPIP